MVLGGCAQADTPTSTPDETPATVSDDANAQGLPSTTTEPTADQTPRSSVSSGTTRSVDKTPRARAFPNGHDRCDRRSATRSHCRCHGGPRESLRYRRSRHFGGSERAGGLERRLTRVSSPGETYTQALVDGYWIVLEAGDITYDYRAARDRLLQTLHGRWSAFDPAHQFRRESGIPRDPAPVAAPTVRRTAVPPSVELLLLVPRLRGLRS